MAERPKGGKSERIQALRKSLYSRTSPPKRRGRSGFSRQDTSLSDAKEQAPPQEPTDVPTTSQQQSTQPRQSTAPSKLPPQTPRYPGQPISMPQSTKRSRYRGRLIITGALFFAAALLLSSLFLFFGQNTISGDNIAIEVEGPFAVGGGDEISFSISILNNNSIPVESATLIVEYPLGTQSVDGGGEELFRDRLPLEVIRPGEVFNVPLGAKVFGEENEEQHIDVSIEYRVEGSNATFYKEAEPLRFKISSSPIIMSVESVEETTAGQEVTFELTITSNAENSVDDLLVKAQYPFGFEFSEASPSPAGGQDTWRISSLDPEEERTITVRGTLSGSEGDEKNFQFSSGVANSRDEFTLASIFSSVIQEIELTSSFFDLNVTVNGSSKEVVALEAREEAQVQITFQNTRSESIYDAEITVRLNGNALVDENVRAGQGLYISSENGVRFSSETNASLSEIAPGDSRTVSFSFAQDVGRGVRTPQVELAVDVEGRQVSRTRSSEELVNTAKRTVRFDSVAGVGGRTLHGTGPFSNTGPVPPVAEEATTYTITLTAENTSNNLENTSITATLPSYVTWLDKASGGNVSYNGSRREVTWSIGALDAFATKEVSFQVSLLPSISQVGTVPTLLGQQRFKATDRFTGSLLQSQAPALSTQLADVSSSSFGSGTVQAP